MKKIFLAICFSMAFSAFTQAKITEILDQSQIPQKQMPPKEAPIVKEISDQEIEQLLKERIQHVVVQPKNKVSFASSSVLPSIQAQQNAAEAQKSTFQKIYEQALRRLDLQEQNKPQREDINAPQLPDTSRQQQQNWNSPNYPIIKTTLPPDNKVVNIPAMEHIPYLMSNINLLPDGMLKFSETVVVVANGKKLRNGLSLALPKQIVSRNKEKQNIDYTLVNVSVNGQDIDYKFVEDTNSFLVVPQKNYLLEPGVYTYKFEYLADNVIWDYGDFKELYWDITGSRWNLVVARAGATLSLPNGGEPLGQTLLIGHPQNLNTAAANIIKTSDDTWGYASGRPIFIGEGLHMIVSLPQNIVASPSWDRRLLRSINNFGDIYVSLVMFAAIFVSFGVSWKYIRANKGQLKFHLAQTPVMMRYLAFNRYDAKSFGCFLLELYRKNIIDIQQADNTILLIKRTDNLKSLSLREQQAVKDLFTGGELVLNVNKNNMLKFRRASRRIEKDLRQNLITFLVKLNIGYLFFSLGMVFIGEVFISLLATNSAAVFTILAASTAALIGGIFLCTCPLKKLWSNILFKALGCTLLLLTVIIMAAVVSLGSIALIIASLLTIRHFTTAYGQRNGLLKTYINELSQTKKNLCQHHDNIVLGREIANKQPKILALDLEKDFMENNGNEYNKLSAMELLLKIIAPQF